MTGGDELAMAAIGIVYERHKDKGIKLHQYNIRTGVSMTVIWMDVFFHQKFQA